MPHIPCEICKKIFYSKPSWIKKGEGKYCSRNCYSKSRMNGKIVKCSSCSSEVYKTLKALNKTKSGKLFCGQKCSLSWIGSIFVGDKHPNWANGEFSYKSVLIRNNLDKLCVFCKTNNEKVLIVHHLDKDRKNNKLNNLTWICRNCHFLVHHYYEENQKLLSKVCQ